jgi:hypothetical protein
MRNFARVSLDILRCGSPTFGDIVRLHKGFGIESVLDLRDDADRADPTNVSYGISPVLRLVEYCGFPLRGRELTVETAERVVTVVDGLPKPVLIHCVRGCERTGWVVALCRVAFQNWTEERAIFERRTFPLLPEQPPEYEATIKGYARLHGCKR